MCKNNFTNENEFDFISFCDWDSVLKNMSTVMFEI